LRTTDQQSDKMCSQDKFYDTFSTLSSHQCGACYFIFIFNMQMYLQNTLNYSEHHLIKHLQMDHQLDQLMSISMFQATNMSEFILTLINRKT
jgi:hypothetical protein